MQYSHHILSCFSPWLTAFSFLWDPNLSLLPESFSAHQNLVCKLFRHSTLHMTSFTQFFCEMFVPLHMQISVCDIQYELINHCLNRSVTNWFLFLIPWFVMCFFVTPLYGYGSVVTEDHAKQLVGCYLLTLRPSAFFGGWHCQHNVVSLTVTADPFPLLKWLVWKHAVSMLPSGLLRICLLSGWMDQIFPVFNGMLWISLGSAQTIGPRLNKEMGSYRI